MAKKEEVSFAMAKNITRYLLAGCEDFIQPVIKLPIDNIVFGKLSDIPLLEMMLNLNVITKEHIEGTVYDKASYQMVMRIIGGKLLMRGQDLVERPDAYAWKCSKVVKAKNKKELGFSSTEGAITYAEVLKTIIDDNEKKLFTQMLVNLKNNLLLIHTDTEFRNGIFLTQKLIDSTGYKQLPNSYDIEWPAVGATGVKLTPVKEGDLLILEKTSFGDAFYIVGRDEAKLTYTVEHVK